MTMGNRLSNYLECLFEFNHELPVALLKVVSEVVLDSINRLSVDLLINRGNGKLTQVQIQRHLHTLLTRRSVWSKCLP